MCIKIYDHHCAIIGKCIGKGNIICFYLLAAWRFLLWNVLKLWLINWFTCSLWILFSNNIVNWLIFFYFSMILHNFPENWWSSSLIKTFSTWIFLWKSLFFWLWLIYHSVDSSSKTCLFTRITNTWSGFTEYRRAVGF